MLAAPPLAIVTDPLASARVAELRYTRDAAPGIRRRRVGKGFRYIDAEGRIVRDAATLARIRSLVLPPAWTDVWITPHAHGHLQATGRDAKGRKQYRYHPRWRETRDATKFHRMIPFASALPKIRACVARDLARSGLPREKILATVVSLLEKTLIRVGNEEYTRKNHSFGLTTLRDRHVRVRGGSVAFRFRGKSGVARAVDLHDRRLAAIVRQCQELPGHELFQYVRDDGSVVAIESGDVNEYLRAACGEDFTAKDFRTWAGTLEAALALQALAPAEDAIAVASSGEGRAAARRRARRLAGIVASAIRHVSAKLGNTPTVCRKSYVHPAVVDGFLDGQLLAALRRVRAKPRAGAALRAEEAAVVAFLAGHLARAERVDGGARRRRLRRAA